jgi:sec-independent protein translocase protein TatC
MKEKKSPDDEKTMPFLDHLDELRRRLIVCAVAIGLGFVIAYIFSQDIFNIIIAPINKALPEGTSIIFIGVTEAFMAYLKMSLVVGIIIALPVILYEIWMFVAPALYANEKRYILPFMFSAMIAFTGGVLFCYFLVLPPAAEFLLKGYTTSTIKAMPTMKEALSLTLMLLFAFGVTFQLPFVMLILGKLGIITHRTLTKYRKFAIVIIAVAAAVITPTPDAVTMLLLAVPLWVLYEISVLLVWLFGKKNGNTNDSQ